MAFGGDTVSCIYFGLHTRKVGGLRFFRWGHLGGLFFVAR